MRTTIVLIVILLATTVVRAQSYQEKLDGCGKTLQEGMKAAMEAKDDARMMKLMGDLRECVIGQTFPDFSATAIGGKKYTLDDLKGKVVMINLWFIGCPPCVAEMPMLDQLNKEFKKKDFVLLAFSTDDENAITNFMKKRSNSYPIFADSRPLIDKTFKMQFGYPMNIILDKEGKIVEFKNGGPLEEPGLSGVKAEFKSIISRELAR